MTLPHGRTASGFQTACSHPSQEYNFPLPHKTATYNFSVSLMNSFFLLGQKQEISIPLVKIWITYLLLFSRFQLTFLHFIMQI